MRCWPEPRWGWDTGIKVVCRVRCGGSHTWKPPWCFLALPTSPRSVSRPVLRMMSCSISTRPRQAQKAEEAAGSERKQDCTLRWAVSASSLERGPPTEATGRKLSSDGKPSDALEPPTHYGVSSWLPLPSPTGSDRSPEGREVLPIHSPALDGVELGVRDEDLGLEGWGFELSFHIRG